jgi:hypothetical protein
MTAKQNIGDGAGIVCLRRRSPLAVGHNRAAMRGPLWPRLASLLAIAHYGFPFSVRAAATPVARLRGLGFGARYLGRQPFVRLLGTTAMTLAWPIGAAFDALRNARALHNEQKRTPLLRIFLDSYGLALTHNVPPLEYRLYRLHESARRADMHHYLYWTDLPALAKLNARRGADQRDVQDKHRFANICACFDLPHVVTLAAFDRGSQIVPDKPFVPDEPRLFVKSLCGSQSQGAERWKREGDLYQNSQSVAVPRDRLAEVLRQSDCIVQPCLENHSELAPRTNGALASLRIVTGLDRAGAAEFVWAMLIVPFGSFRTTTGGIICRLAPETGTITRAFDFCRKSNFTAHPDTGTPLVGLALPFWRQSVDLVRHTHAAAFPRFAFLGWDVVLTDAGPLLLETNSGWSALHHQLLDGPIGRTVFGRLVAEHV